MNEFLPINLPSKCKPYEGVEPADIRVRPYKGKDEIFLAEINPINLEQKFVEVLKNVVSGIDPEKLTLGDRLYIIIWEYINSYSEVTQVKTMCSHCLRSIEVGVDLRILNSIELPDDFKQPFEKTLPSGKKVLLRLFNIKDEICSIEYEENLDNGYAYRLARTIVADGDILDRVTEVEAMSSKDTASIRAFHEEHYHGPEMSTKIKCPKCGEEEEVDIPFDLNFLFPVGEALRGAFGKGL